MVLDIGIDGIVFPARDTIADEFPCTTCHLNLRL